jgi:hypothetical protein
MWVDGGLAMRRFGPLLAIGLLLGCAVRHPLEGDDPSTSGEDDLTGTTSVERGIHFEGWVYLPASADDTAIGAAIARQVKTGIGALRATKVALNDRAARANLDPAKWLREPLSVVDPKTPTAPGTPILRVRYRYDDRAVVTRTLSARSTVELTMLADEYGKHDAPLKTDCTDDPTTDTDSLWYHYMPQKPSCQARIQAEADAVRKESTALGKTVGRIGPTEAARWFMPVVAKLDPPKLPPQSYSPEYDRLFGLGTDKSQLVVYAFTGVDSNGDDPDDALAQEHMKFLRTLLRAQPNLRPVRTDPFVWLLDFYVDGKKLDAVTYDQMFTWVIDKSGYPSVVGTDAGKIADLRRQVIRKFAERWVYWDLPVKVNDKTLTVEVRSFWGLEDGSADARQHAQWRYLEAFWNGDVFLYNGHSHFGHGPLEPTLYSASNFNDRYQLMLVNSCISFNYYEKDFIDMKPGGSKNLDMIVNGLPSYVLDSGVATGRLLAGILEGKKTYVDLLTSMQLDYPWGEKAYDPMRVADGELDNLYSAAKNPLTVTPQAPVYP